MKDESREYDWNVRPISAGAHLNPQSYACSSVWFNYRLNGSSNLQFPRRVHYNYVKPNIQ